MAQSSSAERGVAWWPAWRDVAVDALLALAAAMECLAGALTIAGDPIVPGSTLLGQVVEGGRWPDAPVWLAVGGFAAGAVLLLRRRYPLGVVIFSLLFYLVMGIGGQVMLPIAMYTLVTALFTRGRPWHALAPVIVGVLLASANWRLLQIVDAVGMAFDADFTDGTVSALTYKAYELVYWLLLRIVIPVVLGMYVVARRRLVASLQERTQQLEREQALLAERAERVERERLLLTERTERVERERRLLTERSRIAAEMHDVLARGVSLMVGQANAVEMIAERDPGTAARTAHLIGDIGRQALTELRQILGVLRRSNDGGIGEEDEAQPTVDDIDTLLIEQSRAAGMPVTFKIDGDRRPVGRLVESAAYRVVREALTNVHKHAGLVPTQVLVHYGADALEVVVENGKPHDWASMGLPSSGFGLLGMRERVTAIGGTLSAGATDTGGFRVFVAIPCDASVASGATP